MDSYECAYFHDQGLIYKDVIGEGAFGKLFLVYSPHYDQSFALKKIPESRFHKGEIECLKHICHGNIINLYKHYRFNGHIYMLMEYCPNDLHALMESTEMLPDSQLKKYIHDILCAIKTCHDKKIAHQDIKPSNFLIDKYGRIKICDFGLSNIFHDENPSCSLCKGTLMFMAPELFRNIEYNPIKADIYALGITFFYMATKCYPFLARNRVEFIQKVMNDPFPCYKIRNPLLRDLILRCITREPEQRYSVDELLSHPYFESFDCECNTKFNDVPKTQSLHGFIIKPNIQANNRKFLPNRNSVIAIRKKIPIELRMG